MKPIYVELDGELLKVYAQKIQSQLWVYHKGQTYCIDESEGRRRKGQATVLDPSMILSPMPGKVLKVNFNEGESVKEGDVVVIMEAMKMEYSLAAQKAGVIESLNCEENQQVTKDQKLVQLKVEE